MAGSEERRAVASGESKLPPGQRKLPRGESSRAAGALDEPGCAWRLFYFLVGLLALLASLRLGPVDASRTLYHQVFADGPALKQALYDYCLEQLRDTDDPRARLRALLGHEDPQRVSIERLWDASEELAPSWFERWIWPRLDF